MTSFFHRPYRQVIVFLLVVMSMGGYFTWRALTETQAKQMMHSSIIPEDVVKGWARTFPHTPLLATSLTTEHFRDGRSHDDWVADVQESWGRVDFRYHTGQVESGWTKGNMAHIFYHTTGSSIWGEHDRQEEYLLIRTPEGQWLINDMRLIQEQVL